MPAYSLRTGTVTAHATFILQVKARGNSRNRGEPVPELAQNSARCRRGLRFSDKKRQFLLAATSFLTVSSVSISAGFLSGRNLRILGKRSA